ncbi:polysaccharide deacetylase family protein [Clostridium cellulovorans]|uniref:Polysaccharide deacetylase n=2 Tax=Clostridium cellulovorans TaxID=1493 RepID=D9SLY9_CLOC7|nr:polysaccharide deacetylase family protein [Clostridium cellulovorans]ADL51720.1 polysaccharide deacetylase [Clostridium cellulovorans 743B]BAV13104.1 polysaccharide deacetylase [Clostridium cellulovorans]
MKVIIIRKKRVITVFAIITALILIIFSTMYILSGSVLKVSNSKKKLPIYSVDRNDKKIALTFDSTWGEENTKQILDILDKYEIKATFFLIGKWIDEFNDDAKEIYLRGHEIGNHSNKHKDFVNLTRETLISEIADCDAKIASITGEKPKLLRVPNGSYNDFALSVIEDTHHYCIQWDVDSLDWKNLGSDKAFKKVVSKTKSGSIILFHNGAKDTPVALENSIIEMKKEGYEFVTISQLIYKNNYKISDEGKQISIK